MTRVIDVARFQMAARCGRSDSATMLSRCRPAPRHISSTVDNVCEFGWRSGHLEFFVHIAAYCVGVRADLIGFLSESSERSGPGICTLRFALSVYPPSPLRPIPTFTVPDELSTATLCVPYPMSWFARRRSRWLQQCRSRSPFPSALSLSLPCGAKLEPLPRHGFGLGNGSRSETSAHPRGGASIQVRTASVGLSA
jgi:hypothetical protein